jgi:hypothetical protein
MKKSDIAMIILIAAFGVVTAYLIVRSLPIFAGTNTPVKVKVADKISSEIDEVDKTIFNKDAINPTVEVIIGNNGSSSTQSNNIGTQAPQANENQ